MRQISELVMFKVRKDKQGLLLPVSLLTIFCFASRLVWADTPEVELRIRDHLFFPATLEIPANQKLKIRIYNEDPTPEEFESFELNREKVIVGNSQTVIFIGPLKVGEYPFLGEFYPKTAQGMVVVK